MPVISLVWKKPTKQTN